MSDLVNGIEQRLLAFDSLFLSAYKIDLVSGEFSIIKSLNSIQAT